MPVRTLALCVRELERPSSLGDPQWAAVSQLYVRMTDARARGDIELTIGAAKELVEAVAKMVLDARREVKVQLAVMFLLLGSMATSVTVISLGLTRRLFTSDHRPIRLERSAS